MARRCGEYGTKGWETTSKIRALKRTICIFSLLDSLGVGAQNIAQFVRCLGACSLFPLKNRRNYVSAGALLHQGFRLIRVMNRMTQCDVCARTPSASHYGRSFSRFALARLIALLGLFALVFSPVSADDDMIQQEFGQASKHTQCFVQ